MSVKRLRQSSRRATRAMDGLAKAAKNPADGAAMQEFAGAERMLGGALGRLNVVVEAYPDLKADQNMRQLSEELSSTENRVAFARQAFNDAVTAYNSYRQSFPPVLVAAASVTQRMPYCWNLLTVRPFKRHLRSASIPQESSRD